MIEIFESEKFLDLLSVNNLFADATKFVDLDYNGKISKNYSKIKYSLKYFPCGEFEFIVEEDIKNQEVVVFQSFYVGKFNDDLIKLQIVCDVLKRNNVKNITYFSPFLPYTRQDKIYNSQNSLGLKLIADILVRCGINQVITYDIHPLEFNSFFKCKVSNFSMVPVFIQHIEKNFPHKDVVIVFPDEGAALRVKKFFFNTFKTLVINKVRENQKIKMNILGNIDCKIAIIIDDIADSCVTLTAAADILQDNNVVYIYAYVTHGIFSTGAIKRLGNSTIQKCIVSDSVYRKNNQKIDVIPIKLM
jgi:ribose-phosphate pyrophosphokinase